jgi:two-component system, OmpR family, phosphate regulon sensor histidine kinase PhoR
MARTPPDRARLRLRLGLGVFFCALAVPSGALVYRAYDQLKWESFRGQQLGAEDLAQRIDRRLAEIARIEDSRPAADFGFMVADPKLGGTRRSPLAAFPLQAEIPGLVGWFQVGEDGRFNSPLLPEGVETPAASGLDPAELAARQALAARIEGVLIGNRLVERGPLPAAREAEAVPLAAARQDRIAMQAPGWDEEAESYATAARSPAPAARAPAPAAPARPAPPTVASAEGERSEQPRERLSQSAFDLLSSGRAAAPSKLGGKGEESARDSRMRAGSSRAATEQKADALADSGANAAPPAPRSLGRVEDLALDAALAERVPVAAGGLPAPSEAAPEVSPDAAPALARGGPASAAASAPAAAPPAVSMLESQAASEADTADRRLKKEQAKDKGLAESRAKPAAKAAAAPSKNAASATRVDLFGNAVEPLALGLLDSGHFVLFRSVHKNGERLVQGLLIEQGPFLAALMEEPFRAAPLASTTELIVAFRDEVLAAFRERASRAYVSSARELTGALLYRTRMREPFGGLELIFSVGQLPVPPGAAAIGWVAGLLGLVLVGGTWLMYRLGMRQLALVRQQQAFVSAVSHELKTPLTSIRMYSEMLRAGYADEDRRQVYYRYIQEESERLSRLIANVLALSRIGRDALAVAPQDLNLAELVDQIRERLAAPVERAGFRLDFDCSVASEGARLRADPDALTQILINLVDNALKFAARCEPKLIEIRCDRPRPGWLRIAVRDYGPGIPKEQRQRVFDLFYCGPEASAGAIPGTGIGLALVERLAKAMGGRVELVDGDPGIEARVDLPEAIGLAGHQAAQKLSGN